MPLRLLALDLSLAGTGIAWTHDHRGQPGVGCRTVHTGSMRGHERLHHILTDVAAAARCRPHLVVIEELFHGDGKGAVSLPLAGLHGVITHWLWSQPARIPYHYVHNSHIKMWSTGKGSRVSKQDVKAAVIATYGHLTHIATDDEADALALLSLAAHAYSAPIVPVLDPRKLGAANTIQWPTLAASVH